MLPAINDDLTINVIIQCILIYNYIIQFAIFYYLSDTFSLKSMYIETRFANIFFFT